MKALIKTSIMVVALAGLFSLMAGAAMAAQPEAVAVDADGIGQHYPGGAHLQIDPELISQIQEAMNNPVPPDAEPADQPDDNPIDDGGDNSDNPGDNPADNPDDNPGDNPGDNPEDNPGDNPDNPGDDGDNPGIDDGGQNEDTPDDNTTTVTDDGYKQPTTSKGSSGKLPNTGTQLALLAGAALLIGGVAYVARRAAGKRVR